MNRRPFGKTGFNVSPLGFGGAPIGFLAVDQERVTRVVNLLLDRGLNLIDTAECYAGSEEALGQAVGQRRQDFVLVTKCGHKVPGGDQPEFSAALIAHSVDLSLRRLRTDHLDVVLLHSCGLEKLKQGDALAELVRARAAGKVRFVGYSGDNDAAAYAAGLPDVAVIETSVNLADQHNIDAVLPPAVQRGLGVIAKRPIANAAWKDPAQQPQMYASYASEYTRRLGLMKLDPAALGISGPAEQAWPELALRFTLSVPGVNCAIVGTTNPASAEANLAAAAKGPLPAEVVAKLRQSFAAAQPAAGAWKGET